VDSYTIGGGIAAFVAPLIYLALTTLVCLSPEVTHLLLALLWILFPIAYKAMDGLSDKIRQKSHPTSHTEVPYSPLEVDKDEVQSKLLRADMTTLVWKSQVPFMALFTSNFSAQLLVGGVVTTLAFDKTPVAPRSQYIFYMLALGFGDFLGRSYLGILSTCGVQSKFRIKKNMDSRTWKFIFTCMHGICLVVSAFFKVLPCFCCSSGKRLRFWSSFCQQFPQRWRRTDSVREKVLSRTHDWSSMVGKHSRGFDWLGYRS